MSHGMVARDAYGIFTRVGRRKRHVECVCDPKLEPCLKYVCPGCHVRRPWCCGGAPDVRCDHCTEGATP